jgi:hypothetical protein
MGNLSELKREREKALKKVEKWKKKVDELDDKIAEIEGAPDDMEDIREDAKNYTKDIKKKRSRSNGYNEEHGERIKRLRGTNEEKISNGESIENSGSEITQTNQGKEILQESDTNENNLDNLITREEIIEPNEKSQSKRRIEDLLEEISEEEIKEMEFEETTKEFTEEIPRLYYNLCKQEEILFIGKKEMMKAYYDFGKEFERKLNFYLDEVYEEERTAISKIYKEIKKENENHTEKRIKYRVEKARKIYRIILAAGGREKINKLKNLNSEEYMKFNLKEIEEWVRNR